MPLCRGHPPPGHHGRRPKKARRFVLSCPPPLLRLHLRAGILAAAALRCVPGPGGRLRAIAARAGMAERAEGRRGRGERGDGRGAAGEGAAGVGASGQASESRCEARAWAHAAKACAGGGAPHRGRELSDELLLAIHGHLVRRLGTLLLSCLWRCRVVRPVRARIVRVELCPAPQLQARRTVGRPGGGSGCRRSSTSRRAPRPPPRREHQPCSCV